ncbi:hypothetical protein F5051DRAFT_444779 [Lentinula edodes]|nr:hypothetical protein F5051DRAFT_444779 [Lentinula edodes]
MRLPRTISDTSCTSLNHSSPVNMKISGDDAALNPPLPTTSELQTLLVLPLLDEPVQKPEPIGGGPVGLLLAYQLARFPSRVSIIGLYISTSELCLQFHVTTLASKQDDKIQQSSSGRASAIWPRTIGLFDQLDLAEPLIQVRMTT